MPFSHPEYNDLCQIGRIAALGAARSFSADRGHFFAYAQRVISNAILAECRAMHRRRLHERLVDFSDPCHEASGSPYYLIGWDERSVQIDHEEWLAVAQRRVSCWLESLDARDRQIIESIYCGKLSQADVARNMGLTRARVSQIVSELLMNARVYMKSVYELN